MRKTWLVLSVSLVLTSVQVSASYAEEKNPLGNLIKAFSALVSPAATTPAESDEPAGTPTAGTHVQLKTVSIKGENGATLQTLAGSADGKIVALVAPPRYGGVAGKAKPISAIHVFDADGQELANWKLSFTAQSVAVGPDGIIYVAGDGRLAKFDSQGKSAGEAEVPHLAEVIKDQAKLKAQAEQQLKQEVESYENAKKSFQDQLDKLKAKKAADRTEIDKQQMQSLAANIRAYDQITQSNKGRTVSQVVEQLSSRLRIINGITVTDKEVFIACGELKGYGYAIWRMSLDFKDPKQVLSQIGGCCGQMDIQARGGDLFVCENTRHRVAQYDRDGKLVKSFGKKSRESEGDKFGGCCNPMNCRIGAGGEIFTAESEGVVKKWSADGEFVGTVGVAKLTGGCKNVAVATSPKGDRIYFCDLPGSRIIILGEKDKTPAAGN